MFIASLKEKTGYNEDFLLAFAGVFRPAAQQTMKNTNQIPMMKDQPLATDYRPSINLPVAINRRLAERNQGLSHRASLSSKCKKIRNEEQPLPLLRTGQWINRGENDGLDFFL